MRHVRTLVTTAEALQNVFHVSVRTSYRRARCTGLQDNSCPRAQHFSSTTLRPATYKPFVDRSPPTPRRPIESRVFEARDVDISKFGPKVDRPPRDEEIRAWRAHLRLPNGKLSEPQSLQDILDDRAKDEKGKYTQFVQELAPADPGGGRPFTIVGYIDKKESKDRELAVKKKSKEGGVKEKSLELGWSIGGNDLEHRLGRLKEFLEKGSRVEVVFGSQRIRGWGMKRKVSEEEGQQLVERIRVAALEVEGTKVHKELSGSLLGQARISFQGPGKKEREGK